ASERRYEGHPWFEESGGLGQPSKLPAHRAHDRQRFLTFIEQVIEHGESLLRMAVAGSFENLEDILLPAITDQTIHVLGFNLRCLPHIYGQLGKFLVEDAHFLTDQIHKQLSRRS